MALSLYFLYEKTKVITKSAFSARNLTEYDS